jgi:hypothetical protein
LFSLIKGEVSALKKNRLYPALIFVALLLIIKDHTGTSLGDHIFNTFGLSPWTKSNDNGFYLPGVMGIALLVIATILTLKSYRSNERKVRNRIIIGCILLIWLFPFASEKSHFLLLYHTSSAEKMDYSLKNNECRFSGEENKVNASCSVTVYNYGKANSVSIRPLLKHSFADVEFDAKVVFVAPHQRITLNTDFVGTQKNGSSFLGFSRQVEFELMAPDKDAAYNAMKMREIGWKSLIEEEEETVTGKLDAEAVVGYNFRH